jgi:hypothetical protein
VRKHSINAKHRLQEHEPLCMIAGGVKVIITGRCWLLSQAEETAEAEPCL